MGKYGLIINRLFMQNGYVIKYVIIFLFLITAFFLLFLPVRQKIVYGILGVLGIGLKKIDIQKRVIRKKNDTIPWLSKVVYESYDKRIETPLFSTNDIPVKKFKLTNKTDTVEQFDEVDTLSDLPIPDEKEIISTDENYINLHSIDNDEYYQKVKENWPLEWKENHDNQPKPIETFDNIDEYTDFSDHHLVEDDDSAAFAYPIESDFVKYGKTDIHDMGEYQIETEDYDVMSKNTEDIETIQAETEIEEFDDNNEIDNSINFDDIKKFVDTNANVYLQEKALRSNEELRDYHDELDEDDIFNEYEQEETVSVFPGMEILDDVIEHIDSDEYRRIENEDALILEQTLAEFGIKADVCDIIHGPVVTLFKIIPAPGIRLSKIESLSDNLALRLAAQSIRIIAPIPGEKVVGIEVPNKKRELVSFKEVVNSKNFTSNKFQIPVGIGKDIYGNIIVIDLHRMPHVLIAGATGAGKSVCVNVFLSSILFSRSPDEVRLILIDPKIVELQPYDGIPHLLTPVITDSKDAINALKYLVYEMEQRYALLGKTGVRDISEYRELVKSGKLSFTNIPYIVAFVDEFADLMTTSGKEAELLFARLTAKARAVGIHLILATQRPSADVITGLIKSNVPARFAFQVISYQDSRIILDQKGAEKLLGQGDMLYLSPIQPFPIRLQGAYLGKDEVDLIAEHWKSIAEPEYIDLAEILGIEEESDLFTSGERSQDPLFNEAIEIVKTSKKASASYLQRRLNIGYNRAARMVEEMEEMGIVGPMQGSKPREIIG
ncbi:MAG TPA: DNA translocase FtsK [Spirochaetia bacterium]|nr:DNA translocase FtsK [Spirochaetia bacterium]